ncbi:hypothetical protein P4474_09400 [Geobacillus stearothermophilus]|nr:hypothetical protein [Geobacillus stearothermophilus]
MKKIEEKRGLDKKLLGIIQDVKTLKPNSSNQEGLRMNYDLSNQGTNFNC